MHSHPQWTIPVALLILGLSAIAKRKRACRRFWDDAALADWATPLATLKVRLEYWAAPD